MCDLLELTTNICVIKTKLAKTKCDFLKVAFKKVNFKQVAIENHVTF
jgi:hypothetical protein